MCFHAKRLPTVLILNIADSLCKKKDTFESPSHIIRHVHHNSLLSEQSVSCKWIVYQQQTYLYQLATITWCTIYDTAASLSRSGNHYRSMILQVPILPEAPLDESQLFLFLEWTVSSNYVRILTTYIRFCAYLLRLVIFLRRGLREITSCLMS